MAWIEVSCEVPASMVDALSEFLMRYASSGVVVENRSVDTFSLDSLDETAVKAVACYLPDDENIPETVAAITRYLRASETTFSDYSFSEPHIAKIHEDDWANSWKEHFKPARIGKRFVIKPTWEEYLPADGDIILELDPGMAFGTGTHPTTKMCLEWLEMITFREEPFNRLPSRGATSVLDVGTGSGILALAAARIGSNRITAIDIDPQAVAIALQNLELNGAGHAVQVSTTPLADIGDTFDVVLANILAEELIRLREQLVQRVAPGGCLILSGILTEREQFVMDGFVDTGLRFVGSSREAEWSCLCYQLPA